MAARHGTRRGYTGGCRCGDCKDAQRVYQRRYRERQRGRCAESPQVLRNETPEPNGSPGPVESGVTAEISGLAAEARPGLAQTALALTRVMDNPRAVAQQPAAAKVLAGLLEKLRSASAHGRRGRLAVVRAMSTADL
jgi:hypothetical protein